MVRDPAQNKQRKISGPIPGKRRVRMFSAHQQIHAALVRPDEGSRNAIVPGLSLLPDESAQSPACVNDTRSDTDRWNWEDTCSG